MKIGKLEIAVIITFFLIIIISPPENSPQPVALAAPYSPYEGAGNNLDIHEFASSIPTAANDVTNGTSFTYAGTLYPTGYRGYRLQANVSQIKRFTDPVPNGSFEDTETFTETWNLTNLEPSDPLIQSHSNVTGQDPQDGLYVMDVELPYKKLLGYRTSYIDNEFNYSSTFLPTDAQLLFDIRLSGDITDKDYYRLTVTIWNQGTIKGEWTTNFKDLKDEISDQWSAREILTSKQINGQFLLRITLEKTTDKNEDAKGHIYFDNFRYIIGSQVSPSEANLTLNGEPFIDSPTGQYGSADIYVNESRVEAVPFADCWSTDQSFQFYSTTYGNLTFDYEYAMYIKNVTIGASTTTFSAPSDGIPTWHIHYTVPLGRPPSSHERYSFGLHLLSGWVATTANGSLGPLTLDNVHPASNFVKIGDNEAVAGEVCSIFATSQNFVKHIILQKGPTALGPWINLSSGDYYVRDDYMRVLAELEPIESSPSNFGNVSVYFPNGTIWHYDDAVDFGTFDDAFVSTAWQHTDIDDNILGQQWLVTVSFDNNTQCGNLQSHFVVVIDTDHTRVGWTDGDTFIWSESINVEVIWNNSQTQTPITDADLARVRYLDRNLVVQYVTMSNVTGSYTTSVPTNLMRPNPTAVFYVELFRYGCVNNSYSEGTAISFTFNLVNRLDLIMIKPTQSTGEHEYTGQTSATTGYTCIVKFYDPYQNAYVLDESSIWPDAIVNYTRYDDPAGPTGWTFQGTGEFTHNPVDRTFSKNDASYSSLERVRYNVSMRIEGATWEYQTHQFTIIIEIVNWATDLDALRTSIDYPPTGDGWTLFDQTADSYEVHLYWNELFNVTVFYHFEENTTGISSADSRQIQVGSAPLQNLIEIGGGYYYYSVDTSSLTAGSVTSIYVNTTKVGYASQTILIRLFVEHRTTKVTTDSPGSTIIIPWDSTFEMNINFSDIVTGVDVFITDTPPIITHDLGIFTPIYQNWNNGTYTIIFNGTATEGTYSVLLNFSKNNYQTKLLNYELTIRQVFTLGVGYASPPSIPWGDNVAIILDFIDSEFGQGVPGASITFPGYGIWNTMGVDYWITDFNNGTYLLILDTNNVPAGTQTYTLTITFTKQHYQTTQTVVPFQVNDIQTILLITDTPYGTFIPHGDQLVIILQFNDTSHFPTNPITVATIGCDWNPFFYSVNETSPGVYNITIQTEFSALGTYQLDIWATKAHHRDGTNVLIFRIEEIRTTAQATPDDQSVPIGDNATFTVTYFDLDHGGQIAMANVNVTWTTGYFSVIDTGLGTYIITFNTSISTIGSHPIQIDLFYQYCESQTIFVTLDITRIPLNIEVLDPISGQWIVEYNVPVNITVRITDHLGAPINDAIVQYRWDGRGFMNFTHIGTGLYNVTFLANASVGALHLVTIQASNPAKYSTSSTSIRILVNPTPTELDNIVDANLNVYFGDSFVLSVNFTTSNGEPISGATVLYVLRDPNSAPIRNGTLTNVAAGIYNVTVDTSGLEIDVEYRIFVSAAKTTLSEKTIRFTLTITSLPTELSSIVDSIRVQTNSPFEVRVFLNDTHNGLLIPDANLTITIQELNINSQQMNYENGIYYFQGFSGLIPRTYIILIEAATPYHYQRPAPHTIYLEVVPDPLTQNISSYVAAAAVIVIILILVWVAYVRVFSVPWMVRKMRKMTKSIGKGVTPTLSIGERIRIADRSQIMSEIVEPYYGSVGMVATPIVMPLEIDLEERDAENEAIWAQLKELPFIEYEQKLELFQQMKQIAPSERVWFIEDLKKQMADGTRFARKPKEPEISEDLEKLLRARLALFPALSETEKVRIAAQLRKMPKEDWDEIFDTLAISQVSKEDLEPEVLRPDEFPSLTEEERRKVLEQIEGLTDEEREKILKTLREKHDKRESKEKSAKEKRD